MAKLQALSESKKQPARVTQSALDLALESYATADRLRNTATHLREGVMRVPVVNAQAAKCDRATPLVEILARLALDLKVANDALEDVHEALIGEQA